MQLFYELQSDDQFVYHYTKAATLVQYILPTLEIRFSRLEATNDPREYKCWEFGFGTNANFDPEFEDLTTAGEASNLVKANCHVFCSTLDDSSSVGMGIDKINGRGFCRPRMWAQYAENHTSACLVFVKAALHRSIEAAIPENCSLYFGPVAYRNRSQAPSLTRNPFILNYDYLRTAGLRRAMTVHVQQYYRELFLEKSFDWADEREYRWLTNPIESGQLLVPIQSALAAVVLGDNVSGSLENVVATKARDAKFKVGRLNWKLGVPEILPVN